MEEAVEHNVIVSFWLMVILIIAVAAASLLLQSKRREINGHITQERRVINLVDQMRSQILEAQAAGEGYSLSGDTGLLKDHEENIRRIVDTRARLQAIARDEGIPPTDLQALNASLEIWQSRLRTDIPLHRQKRSHYDKRSFAQLHNSLANIQKQLVGLRQTESQRLTRRIQTWEQFALYEDFTSLGMGAIALALLARIAGMVRKDIRQRRKQEEIRQQHDAELKEAHTHLSTLNTQLEVLAATDSLTNLKNRRAFEERLTEEWARATRYSTALSLLLLDVDEFKPFNDTYGHLAGDQILIEIANLSRSCTRSSDLVARFGGEEFAIILPETNEAGAMEIAERLRQRIAENPWPQRTITVSIGVTTLHPDTESAIRLVEEADTALYRAKTIGRNRVEHWQPQ